jgi:hypothetical protein
MLASIRRFFHLLHEALSADAPLLCDHVSCDCVGATGSFA